MVACIVEGQGEVRAVPLLVRRVGELLDPPVYPLVPEPIRSPHGKVLHRADEVRRTIELTIQLVGGHGGIFILLDSDEDCPVTLAQQLREQAVAARGAREGLPISVVLAQCEYEAWFLAGAASLRSKRGLKPDLEPPPNPEGIRGAKEWLSTRMVGKTYGETTDQAPLTQLFDIPQALASARSFRKCYKEIANLLVTLSTNGGADVSSC